MVIHRDDGTVSWVVLGIICSVAVVFAGGAIWLGAVAKQVEVNTNWVRDTNAFLNEVRQHNSDTLAREKSFEERLNKLELRLENERRDHRLENNSGETQRRL